ncbi:MAG: hypothetical protein IJ676_04325, partial [Clostridia bacterium]|nr:hypothetical protein [Clostridia bacterium]
EGTPEEELGNYPAYSPEVKAKLFGYNEESETYDLLGIELILKNFLDLRVAIEAPTIDIARGDKRLAIKEYDTIKTGDAITFEDHYTKITEKWDTSLKLSVEGELDLAANDSRTLKENGEVEGTLGSTNASGENATINVGELLRTLLGDNFNVDLIVDTQETVGADLHFYIDATINIMKIYNLLRGIEVKGEDGKVTEIPAYKALNLSIPEIISQAGVEAYIEIVSRERLRDEEGNVVKGDDGKDLITQEKVIAGIYLIEEMGTDGETYISLYIDLSSLHVSPIKVKNLTKKGSDIWILLQGILGTEEAAEQKRLPKRKRNTPCTDCTRR